MNDRRTELRRALRARRHERTESDRRSASVAVRDCLVESGSLTIASIALYRPIDGELDPALIGETARSLGAATYYPSVTGDALRFVEWDGHRDLRRGEFGIEEPESTLTIPAEDLELVIVPLVGFDDECHRIGMGRGYYDRAFSFVGKAETTSRPRLVGIAFDEQRSPRIEPQEWDVTLDAVVTPTRTIVRR